MDVDRKPGTPGPEMKDCLILKATVVARVSAFFFFFFLRPSFHGVSGRVKYDTFSCSQCVKTEENFV